MALFRGLQRKKHELVITVPRELDQKGKLRALYILIDYKNYQWVQSSDSTTALQVHHHWTLAGNII